MIYLASPYSSPDPEVVEGRVREVAAATAKLIERGDPVFSPILHSHPIAHLVSFDPLNHAEGELSGWMAYDFEMIRHAKELWVLMMDDWHRSRGVKAEIEYAWGLGKKIRYLDSQTLEVRGTINVR